MLRPIILVFVGLTMTFCAATGADPPGDALSRVDTGLPDLYRVAVRSHAEAEVLKAIGTDPLLRIAGGYLVLADGEAPERLTGSGLEFEFVAAAVSRREIALDIRPDRSNVRLYPLIYEGDGIRLFRVSPDELVRAEGSLGLAPLRTEHLKIFYRDPQEAASRLGAPDLEWNLDSLVSRVSQDSLEAYSYFLQAYRGRPTGSSSCNNAGSWIAGKLSDFGYDSVVFDEFHEVILGEMAEGRNIVCYKEGTVYPLDCIIIGGHYDTERACPGADDNGSGVVATMEIARALADVETEMTMVFIFFDAEEEGLLGAWHYANQSAQMGRRIAFMLNMDMISFYRNTDMVKLYHGPSTAYAELWCYLVDSLTTINVSGYLAGGSGFSDHAPFVANGYDVAFPHEDRFSNVYHTPRDSTTYMSFEYLTHVTMGSLATAYYVDRSYIPEPAVLVNAPDGLRTFFMPDSVYSLRIRVQEYAGGILIPGSVVFHYSINDGPAMVMDMIDLGGGLYEIEFPPLSCLDRISYYVIAAEQVTGRLVCFPSYDPPAEGILATSAVAILDDDFQYDRGWTSGGDASSGTWERWRAAGNNADPTFDYDGSGKCYMTDHEFASDVDRGTASLLSPALDLINGNATFEYARWFSNHLGGAPFSDFFKVYLEHGGQSILAEIVGPVEEATGSWYTHRFWLHEFLVPEGPVHLRFDATDAGLDSDVEAAVDAVKIIYYTAAPTILNDSLPDGTIGVPYVQQLEAITCVPPLTWSDKYNDLETTGLILSPDGLVSGTVSDTIIVSFTALVVDGEGLPREQVYTFKFWVPLVCGDATREEMVNLGDAVYLVNYVFKQGPAPIPLCVGDTNHDSSVNVGDAVYLINYIFKHGPAPDENCCP